MESLQHKVLDFPMPDDSFDPNFTPEDGTQYLQQVVHERKHCPEVVVKPFVNDIPNKPLSWNTLLQTDFVDTSPSQLRPSKEWKKMQITEFLSIRQRISSMRELFRSNMPDNLPELPAISDPKPWLEYCKNNLPILRIMLQIDQRMLEVLLDYQLKWFDDSMKNSLDLVIEDSWLGTWIYSTLSCLHLPLEPDTHSMLRQIAKCCVIARNRLTVDDIVQATPFNLLICIISSCFDQMDFKSMNDEQVQKVQKNWHLPRIMSKFGGMLDSSEPVTRARVLASSTNESSKWLQSSESISQSPQKDFPTQENPQTDKFIDDYEIFNAEEMANSQTLNGKGGNDDGTLFKGIDQAITTSTPNVKRQKYTKNGYHSIDEDDRHIELNQ